VFVAALDRDGAARVAGVIAFMASDEAACLTGGDHVVDGGYLAK
jgi:NAD(P)-dependent dehydrogenase (short-subunit alcohol dehydrogenase family)